ncbi:MAG: hypothetical protein ACTTJ9_09650 [Segatella oris]|uniref:hypothetical protein n=1 Tax=Segatella oris TaxID=28135 RepID=UPI003FA2D9BB
MKTKTSKRMYLMPACEVFRIESEGLLKASGNAGTIGGGSSGGDAKQGWFDEEDTEFEQGTEVHSAWEE